MENISIIADIYGNKIVLINNLRFQSRRQIDWDIIENYLKGYIDKCFVILETSEKIYIDADFPDEFSHSEDTIKLKGANEKAKANIITAIGELVQIASDKTISYDYGGKHGRKAKLGWHRYTTRFGIPVYDKNDALIRYNIYLTKMLTRCDESGRLYLYDFVRIKKETSNPLEQ